MHAIIDIRLQRVAQLRTGDPQGPLAAGPADDHAAQLPSQGSLHDGGGGGGPKAFGRASGRRSGLGRRRSSVEGATGARRSSITRQERLDDLDFDEDAPTGDDSD